MMDPNDQIPPDEMEFKRREDCPRVIDDQINNAIVSNNNSIWRPENFGNRFSSLLAKLYKANKDINRANIELKKKTNLRRRLLANYEVMLSQKVSTLSGLYKELEKYKILKEADKKHIENLKSHVVQLECQLWQFKGLKLWKDEMLVKKLRREVYKMGSIKRMEKISADYLSQLDEKDAEIKKWEHQNKVVMHLLKEFGARLARAGLLTDDFKRHIVKKYGKEYFLFEPTENQESSGAYCSQLVEKDNKLKKLLLQNDKIMCFLKEFGTELLQNGGLTAAFTAEIFEKYGRDYFSIGPSMDNAQWQMGNEAEAEASEM